MPESRSDLLKISPELKSGRMWHDPQNCSFPELEESVSILSKVHPLQPEEKKVRQKTSTVARLMVQQPQNSPRHPRAPARSAASHYLELPRGSTAPAPPGSAMGGLLRGTKHRTGPGAGTGLPGSPRPYLAGCPWAGTGGLSFVRLSVLLPTARPGFAARDNWSYKVPTLQSMSTLITAGPADLQTQNRLEHWDLPRHIPVTVTGTPQSPPPAQLSVCPTPWNSTPSPSPLSIHYLLGKTCLKLF